MNHRILYSIGRQSPRSNTDNLIRSLGSSLLVVPCKTTLPNGIRILSEHVAAAQSFALGVWIDVGSCDEAADEHGITHFIEHLAFRGTASPERTRSSLHIAYALESVGGYLNAFTTKDHTCYYARALNPHFMRSLELLSDLCQFPVFNSADIEKERAIILEEIKSLEDEPEELINDYMDEQLFGTGSSAHPYAHPISGTEHTIRAIQRVDIVRFHQRHYTNNRIIIAVSGNIHHDQLVRQVERVFSASSLSQASQRCIPEPQQRTSTIRYESTSAQQTHLSYAALIPYVANQTYYILAALNIILGDGMSSRLHQRIREKHGLCYTIYSALSEIRHSAILSIYACFEPEHYDKVYKLIRTEVTRIAEQPVRTAELRRAKEQLKSSLIMGLESLSGRMTLLAKSELYTGTFDSVKQKIALIESISSTDILTLAQCYLQEHYWHTVVLSPRHSP
ncbi:MAG: pitrilysin family protein [Bacteroidota bacterium]|nr:insulinase family protein [Candidatus Kapabacteria bacterium]MDW8219799.1 pitrilysin family protein [Bacteroidota bacterium]